MKKLERFRRFRGVDISNDVGSPDPVTFGAVSNEGSGGISRRLSAINILGGLPPALCISPRRGGFVKTRNVKRETDYRRLNLRINPPMVDIPISCVSPR